MTLMLSNGLTVPACSVKWCGDQLQIAVPASVGFVQVVQIFDDPYATKEIICDDGDQRGAYQGYTHIANVRYPYETPDVINLVLDKGGE